MYPCHPPFLWVERDTSPRLTSTWQEILSPTFLRSWFCESVVVLWCGPDMTPGAQLSIGPQYFKCLAHLAGSMYRLYELYTFCWQYVQLYMLYQLFTFCCQCVPAISVVYLLLLSAVPAGHVRNRFVSETMRPEHRGLYQLYLCYQTTDTGVHVAAPWSLHCCGLQLLYFQHTGDYSLLMCCLLYTSDAADE